MLSLGLYRLGWKAWGPGRGHPSPGLCRVQLGTCMWPCLSAEGCLEMLPLGRRRRPPCGSRVKLLAVPTPLRGILTPHRGLGSAGEVSQTRACRPGEWGGLVPPPWSGEGQASGRPESLLQVLCFCQSHCPSEGGVLGPGLPSRSPPQCAHAVAHVHALEHPHWGMRVCVRACTVAAHTRAVPGACFCSPLGFPERRDVGGSSVSLLSVRSCVSGGPVPPGVSLTRMCLGLPVICVL